MDRRHDRDVNVWKALDPHVRNFLDAVQIPYSENGFKFHAHYMKLNSDEFIDSFKIYEYSFTIEAPKEKNGAEIKLFFFDNTSVQVSIIPHEVRDITNHGEVIHNVTVCEEPNAKFFEDFVFDKEDILKFINEIIPM